MRWEVYQQAFEWDGSWRDLYVLETSIEDWHRFADFLKASPYELTFKSDEIPDFYAGLDEIFRRRPDIGALLSVNVHGMILNCHFFVEEDIEMDLDPREIVGGEQWDQLKRFVLDMAEALQKEVILTPENAAYIPLLRFYPTGRRVKFEREVLS